MRTLPAASIALVLALAVPAGESAGEPRPATNARDMCPRGKVHRGTPLDLFVKHADLHDLFRLLGDVGRVNIVIADGVSGKTTLSLKRVPWDRIVCTVAASHKLEVRIDGNVVLVRRAAKP